MQEVFQDARPRSQSLVKNLSTKDLVKTLEVNSIENFDEDYVLVDRIGQGSFGAVYKARHKLTTTSVAIKSLHLNPDEVQEISREIEIMKECDSEFVVRYYGYFFKDKVLWIIMEYCGMGSCRSMMNKRNSPFSEQQVGAIVGDALKGLSYLHTNQKVHRDIKADNLLMNDAGECKLADFGVSGRGVKMKTVIGTPLFLAPEVVVNDGFYDCKVDVWSLGITTIELMEFLPPHFDADPMRVLFNIPSNPPPTLKTPEKVSPELNDFIAKCLIKAPEQRPSAELLLQHPFIVKNSDRSDLKEIMDWMKRKREEEKLDKMFAADKQGDGTPEKKQADSELDQNEDQDLDKELQEYKDMLERSMAQQIEEKKKEIQRKKKDRLSIGEDKLKEQLTDSMQHWLENMEKQKETEQRDSSEKVETKDAERSKSKKDKRSKRSKSTDFLRKALEEDREREKDREKRDSSRRAKRRSLTVKQSEDMHLIELPLGTEKENRPRRDSIRKKRDKKYHTISERSSRRKSTRTEIGKTLQQIMEEENKQMEKMIQQAEEKMTQDSKAAAVVKSKENNKTSLLAKLFRARKPMKDLELKSIVQTAQLSEQQMKKNKKKEKLEKLLEKKYSPDELRRRGIAKSASAERDKRVRLAPDIEQQDTPTVSETTEHKPRHSRSKSVA